MTAYVQTLSPKLGLVVHRIVPRTFTPILQYVGSGWLDEAQLLSFSLSDTIANRVRVLEAMVTNPSHNKESIYTLYQEIRVRDQLSGFTLFYGHNEMVEPSITDLKVTARDGLSELAERKVTSLTGGPFTKRSAMISALISQNSYGSNFSLTGIETSYETGSFNRDFGEGKEGPSVLGEIQRVATEEPWDATPTGYGYDFNIEFVSDSAKQKFNYWKRGTKPSNPSSNGLTLKFGGDIKDKERPIHPGYRFTKEGTEIVTCIRVRYLEWIDPADHDKGKEWAYVTATDSSLETAIKRRKMIVVDRPEIETSTEAQGLANALLDRVSHAEILRGTLTFSGFPLVKLGAGNYSLVRAGHLVYVTGLSDLPILNNTNMFVTSLVYRWPEHITECQVLTSAAMGLEYPSYQSEQHFQREWDLIGDIPRMTPTLPAGYKPGDWPGDLVLPSTPTGLSLTTGVETDADGKQVVWLRATWTANPESDILNYTIRYYRSGYAYQFAYSSTNEIKLSPVVGGQTYYVAIAAVDRWGNAGTFCSEQNIVTAADTTPPGPCSALTASASFHNIFLDWTNPTDLDLDHIEVWRANTNDRAGAVLVAEVKTTWYIDFIGTYGTTRYYWIRAIDSSGNASTWYPVSATGGISATTADIEGGDFDKTAPATPTGLALTTGVAQGADGTEYSWVRATWNANGEGDFSHYEYRIKETGGNYSYGYVTAAEVLFTRVRANILHYVGVRAIDLLGNKSAFTSDQSTTSAKDTTAPGAPSSLAAVSAFKTIFLTWTNPTDADLDLIEVWRANTNDRAGASKITEILAAGYADNIGTYSVTRYYWIRAVDTSGNTSTWYPVSATGGISATTGYVDYTDINDFAIRASKIWTKIPILSGDSWTDNSPSAGYVAWNAHTLYYDGVAHAISGGNTNLKYVYWIKPNTSYTASDTNPTSATLGDDGFVIAVNIGGTHDLAWNAIANQVIGSAYIQDLAVTNAKICNLAVDDAKINDLNASKITAGDIATLRMQVHAGDAVNAGSVSINPGQILISGTTKLSDWRHGSDLTQIDGGDIYANSITANKIVVGSRNLSIQGIEISAQNPTANTLYWGAGVISYIKDDNTTADVSISSGNVLWSSGTVYLYWVKDATSLSTTTTRATAFGANNVVLATYRGGTDLVVTYGRTIIDGSDIVATTITGDRLIANTITATQLSTGELITLSAQIKDAIIDDAKIVSIAASKITTGDIATDRISANAANAVNAGTIRITAAKLIVGASTQFDTGYNPSSKSTVFRQTTEPTTGMIAGDLWFDTDNGDKPHLYNGASWEMAYTVIDGGYITTNTIALNKLTFTPYVIGTNNADSIVAGASYKIPSIYAVDLTTGYIDFSKAGFVNKNATYIDPVTGRQWAAESGADVTGSHTANDTSYVSGYAASSAEEGAKRGNAGLDSSGYVAKTVPGTYIVLDANVICTGDFLVWGKVKTGQTLTVLGAISGGGGKVVMDSSGLHIKGQYLFFEDLVGNVVGYIYGGTLKLTISSEDITIDANGTLTLESTYSIKAANNFVPTVTSVADLGTSSLVWEDLYIENVRCSADGAIFLPQVTDYPTWVKGRMYYSTTTDYITYARVSSGTWRTT